MDIQNIEKINFSIASNLTIILIGFIVPGFLLWYIHSPELFERLDFLKLLMLSIAVCLPTFLIQFVTTALMYRLISDSRPELADLWGTPVDWFVRHGYSNSVNMYSLIFIIWFLDLGTRATIWMVVAGIVFGFLSEIIHYRLFLKRPSSLYGVWLVKNDK